MYYTLTIQRGGIFTAGEGRHIKISKGLNSAKRTHNKRRPPPFGHHRCRHIFPFCLDNILGALGGIELTTPRLARRSVYRWTTANTKATFANTGHPGSPLFLPVTWPPLEIAREAPPPNGVLPSCAASPPSLCCTRAGMHLRRAALAILRLALATAMPASREYQPRSALCIVSARTNLCLSLHCGRNINELGDHPLLDDHRVTCSSHRWLVLRRFRCR